MAQHGAHVPQDECDHIAANLYGWEHSGEVDAAAHWEHVQPWAHGVGGGHPHPADLLFWTGGSGGHGHVALQARKPGYCYSPDIAHAGRYSLVRTTLIHQRWGLTFVGFCSPAVFPNGSR